MNSDPYRGASQPADRRVINRSGATPYRPADEPQPIRDDAPSTSTLRQASARRDSAGGGGRSKKGLLWTIVAVVLIALIAVAGWMIWSNTNRGTAGIDTSRYQAVFLSNGQIYFGKLSDHTVDAFKITNVYYPQAQANTEEGAETDVTTQSSIQLYAITEGVHGPEDEMLIMKSQVLYYENLRTDSQVAELIERNGQ